jgi:uncharacterized protein (TIGR03435 family)
MTDFATWMQAGVMDRPVVDKTELSDRYDFNWIGLQTNPSSPSSEGSAGWCPRQLMTPMPYRAFTPRCRSSWV